MRTHQKTQIAVSFPGSPEASPVPIFSVSGSRNTFSNKVFSVKPSQERATLQINVVAPSDEQLIVCSYFPGLTLGYPSSPREQSDAEKVHTGGEGIPLSSRLDSPLVKRVRHLVAQVPMTPLPSLGDIGDLSSYQVVLQTLKQVLSSRSSVEDDKLWVLWLPFWSAAARESAAAALALRLPNPLLGLWPAHHGYAEKILVGATKRKTAAIPLQAQVLGDLQGQMSLLRSSAPLSHDHTLWLDPPETVLFH